MSAPLLPLRTDALASEGDALRLAVFEELLEEGGLLSDPLSYARCSLESRLASRLVLRSLSLPRLSPPRTLEGPAARPSHVWYASYGSNLSTERFLCYVRGGTPLGAARLYTGVRDQRLPDGWAPRSVLLPGGVHFALTSRVWGGGIAFFDPSGGESLGRVYRLTFEQFEDVVAQENHLPLGSLSCSLPLPGSWTDLRSSAYGRLHHLGDLEGLPVLTFTSSVSARESLAGRRTVVWMGEDVPFTPTRPTVSYLRMLATGVGEAAGISSAGVEVYLSGLLGAAPGGRSLESLLG